MLGETLSCDTSVAEKVIAARLRGGVLRPRTEANGHLPRRPVRPLRYRRGQYGCLIKGEGPSCDETVSQPGDPCGLHGQVVCATDGKTELVCLASS
jgi:hypothetical protein